jgi:methylmalonyl-CoA carboxyltransferase 1.3S subunit
VQLTLTIDGKKYLVDVEVEEGEEVRLPGSFPEPVSTLKAHPVAPQPSPQASPQPAAPPVGGPGDEKICRSPIAGVVFKIVAQEGQQIEADDLLVVLEAMKMETNITAHAPGKIAKILVAVGEAVKPGQAIAEFV